MNTFWLALLDEQRRTHFSDLAGSRMSVRVPITDRLLNRVVASALPRDWPIGQLTFRAVEGNAFDVRIHARSAFLPHLRLRLVIDQQPRLPDAPRLVLRLTGSTLGVFAGSALKLLGSLPRGIEMAGDRISIDLGELARHYGLSDLLTALISVELTTADGHMVVVADGAIPFLSSPEATLEPSGESPQ